MKKNILLSILVLSTFFKAYTQNKYPVNTLSVSAGPSFPVGHYAGKNLEDEKAGLAGPGEQINISFEHKLNKTIGIAAVLYGTRNPVNTTSIEKQLDGEKFIDGFALTTGPGQPIPGAAYITYPNWKMDKKSWLSAALLAGPSIDIPFSTATTNFSFTAKAMIGVMYASSPKLQGKSNTDTVIAQITQNSASAFAFSYLLGAGIQYNKCKHISIHAGIDYLAAPRVTFKDATASFAVIKYPGSLNVAESYSSITTTAKQPVAVMNLTIGIGIKL